jgi:hypothetical protein
MKNVCLFSPHIKAKCLNDLIQKHLWLLWLEVLMSLSMKMAGFWVVALCWLVWRYQHFRSLYCLHHRPDGCSTDFWNVAKLIPVYMVLQHRRRPSSFAAFLLRTVVPHLKIVSFKLYKLCHENNFHNQHYPPERS